jgi:hypothetical protein
LLAPRRRMQARGKPGSAGLPRCAWRPRSTTASSPCCVAWRPPPGTGRPTARTGISGRWLAGPAAPPARPLPRWRAAAQRARPVSSVIAGQPEPVAAAQRGLHDHRMARVGLDLAAQVLHVRVDGPLIALELMSAGRISHDPSTGPAPHKLARPSLRRRCAPPPRHHDPFTARARPLGALAGKARQLGMARDDRK